MNRFLRAGLLAVLVSLVASTLSPVATAAERSVFHVSPKGDDGGDGSPSDPWRHLDESMDRLQPGQTLVVHGGTYRERARIAAVPATAEEPIRVVAAPGERPVLEGFLYMRAPQHWTVDGLDITGDGGSYARNENLLHINGGDGWTYQHAEIWGVRGPSALVSIGRQPEYGPPKDWRLRGLCLHDIEKSDWPDPWVDHHIYVANGENAPGRGWIERNVAWRAPNGNNVKIAGSGEGDGSSNVTVRYNSFADAFQNVLVAWTTHDVLITDNVLARGYGEPRYPNLRAHEHTGKNVVARRNTGGLSDELIGADRWTDENGTGIQDGGGNVHTDPDFDTGNCAMGGQHPAAAGRGHAAAWTQDEIERFPTVRLHGASRLDTAIASSRMSHPQGAATVVLARSDDYPDALAGSPLATSLDAPILLTGRDGLDAATRERIIRLGTTHVVLLGGTSALSSQVERDLRSIEVDQVDRVAGRDRFETAAKIANELRRAGGDTSRPFIAQGGPSWADAVAVSAYAASTGRPVLLATRDSLSEPTASWLETHPPSEATLIGGVGVLSEEVENAANKLSETVDRLWGSDRFATSWAVAEAHRRDTGVSDLWMATGANWPDALTAGPAAGSTGSALLLVGGDHGPARKWIASSASDKVALVGGAVAISTEFEDAVRRQQLISTTGR